MDSLSALPEVATRPAGSPGSGTGRGLPGIPLAIASRREFILLDSVRKKAAALREFVAPSSCRCRVERRASRRATLSGMGSVLVCGRACRVVAPESGGAGSSAAADGGLLVCLKGRLEQEELERDVAPPRCAGSRARSEGFALPGGGEQRTIVELRKAGKRGSRCPDGSDSRRSDPSHSAHSARTL